MLTLVPDAIERYAHAHSTSEWSELLERLRVETVAKTTMPQMQVGAAVGQLLGLLVKLLAPRHAVEIGTFTGCSGLHIGAALSNGRLVTIDINPDTTAIARRYFDEAGLADRVEARLGPALDVLEVLRRERAGDPLDFVFIDADKGGYSAYWDAVVPDVRPGGLICVDNVLWSGRVLDPKSEDDHAIVRFNAKVAADPRVEQVMLTVRDGLTLARKR
ncbi:MAG: class I SAM-dependent methyltransferase [Myxococcales bacterium]|nr:class I SAM-dependent methyltransferase [Myxococcales bacterium]